MRLVGLVGGCGNGVGVGDEWKVQGMGLSGGEMDGDEWMVYVNCVRT